MAAEMSWRVRIVDVTRSLLETAKKLHRTHPVPQYRTEGYAEIEAVEHALAKLGVGL